MTDPATAVVDDAPAGAAPPVAVRPPSVARQGYALVLASYATAGLGLVYWLLAGRMYDEDVVGVCAALISALTFLANLSTLGLKNGLLRFVPVAGRHTSGLVATAYTLTWTVGLVAGVAFVAGRQWWAADMDLAAVSIVSVCFVLGTAFWVVFVLQDSVLVGLGHATWVPLENSLFAVAKLLLLVVFADRATQWGVFYSWVVPVLPIVAVIGAATVWSLRRSRPRRTSGEIHLRTLTRFAVADHAASLTWQAASTLLPLVVLARAGAETNAHYFMAWSIAYGLYLVVVNFGDAYVASAAAHPDRADDLLRNAALHTLRLTVPGVAVIVVGAPWILGFVGRSYADEATTALRVLALSALPFVVVGLSIARARLELRMRAVWLTFTALSVAVLVMSAVLIGPFGATGVAVAWLVAQTAVAAALVWQQFRGPRPPRHRRPAGATLLDAASPPTAATASSHRDVVVTVAVLGIASVAWLAAAAAVDPDAMTDLGLLSVLPWPFYAALAIVVVATVNLLRRDTLPERLLFAHVSALIVFIHGLAPLVYGTLRYGWAWKHVGLVEFISRTGTVDRDIDQLDVYHNWPGFFSGNALLSGIVGPEYTMRMAIWAPLVFSLVWMVALLFVLGRLADDRRVVWLAVLFFFVSNWVGQEYFAPQAMAYLLHLVILGLVLLAFGRRDPSGAVRPPLGRGTTAALSAVIVVLVVAMVSSHQLTPGATTVAVAGLLLTRRIRGWLPLAIVAAAPVVWALTFAQPYVERNIGGELASFGTLFGNTGGGLADAAIQSPGQQLVTTMGRTTVVFIGLAALVGVVRRWRRGHRDLAAIALMVTPGGLLVANDFDGEIIFRVFLFAAPFLALFAAFAVLPSRDTAVDRRSVVLGAALASLLLTGFLFGHFGKERQNYFSPDEIAAATSILDLAPDGALVIEAVPYYPSSLLRYEQYVHVPISTEPPASRDRILADPVTVLAGWLRTTEQPDGFVIITRSQQALAEATGDLPVGALDFVVARLESSPDFDTVFSSPNAVVFRLDEGAR